MAVDTVIAGGTLVTAQRTVKSSIAIDDGIIVAVGDERTLPNANQIFDATGKYIFPGIVDPHAHIEGYYSIDSYESGTAAAALGGVTTIINFAWQAWVGPGPDSISIWDEEGTLLDGIARQKQKGADSLVDFGLHGGISREDPTMFKELDDVIDEGVTSFKMFTAYEQGISNGFINQVFERLADRDVVAVLHTEDQSVIDNLTAQLQAADKGDPEWYPKSRPPFTESMAADDALRMARNTGVQYYGFHTSCGEVADVIGKYQEDGSKVRGETCTHYTVFSDDAYTDQGTLPIIAPPLRSQAAVNELFEQLQSGALSVVSTDHTAFPRESKEVNQWWESTFGVNSLQYSLPVFHDVAINERGLSYPFLVRVMCTNPARTFGMPEKGTLDIGTDADLVVFDPNQESTISAAENASRADYTIYEGRIVTGVVEKTFVRGTLVADDGEIVSDPGHGEFVKRETPTWGPLPHVE